MSFNIIKMYLFPIMAYYLFVCVCVTICHMLHDCWCHRRASEHLELVFQARRAGSPLKCRSHLSTATAEGWESRGGLRKLLSLPATSFVVLRAALPRLFPLWSLRPCAQVAEGASRWQQLDHIIPTSPTLGNHSTHSTVEEVWLQRPSEDEQIRKLLTNWKEGGETMKVRIWRVALGQQIKPKIKTKERNSWKLKIKAKIAKKVLVTFQLQAWLARIRVYFSTNNDFCFN